MSPSVEAWMYAEIGSPWGWENNGKYSQSVKKVGFGRRLAVISAAWFCWIVVRAASKVWLCRSANWMASSSVILAGPGVACPNAGPVHGIEASTAQTDQAPRLMFKGGLRCRQHILISRDPDIERGQKDDAQQQIGNQAAHNDDCESDPMSCDSAAGSSPRVATSMVIIIGRSLRTAPSTAASTIEWPRARSWLMYSSMMTPVCTDTPKSANMPTPEDTLR